MILSIRPGFMSKHSVYLHKALDSEGFQTTSPINTLKFLIILNKETWIFTLS